MPISNDVSAYVLGCRQQSIKCFLLRNKNYFTKYECLIRNFLALSESLLCALQCVYKRLKWAAHAAVLPTQLLCYDSSALLFFYRLKETRI